MSARVDPLTPPCPSGHGFDARPDEYSKPLQDALPSAGLKAEGLNSVYRSSERYGGDRKDHRKPNSTVRRGVKRQLSVTYHSTSCQTVRASNRFRFSLHPRAIFRSSRSEMPYSVELAAPLKPLKPTGPPIAPNSGLLPCSAL